MRGLARGSVLTAVAVGLLGNASLPTYTPAYEPTTVDERGLWLRADEIERALRDSALVIKDEALNAYVRRVLCTTVGEMRCKAVRIYIVETPVFNASMSPNGTMIVWTGLLLRARSEAELASVLGHEFAHFELRHSLNGFKNKRGLTDAMAWVSVLGGFASTNVQAPILSLLGSAFRYDRSQEKAADRLGLQYLAASPYPAMAAAELWRSIMAEADATAQGRKLKSKHPYTAGFFDSHPTELQRATELAAAAAVLNDEGDPRVDSHRAAIAPLLPKMLAGQIGLNDFGGSEYLLARLAATGGWTGDLLFARGELYRQRANPRDLMTAAQLYGEALKAGHNGAELHRNLGLALMRSGETSGAKASLSEYLKMKPDAGDAKLIQSMLAE